MQFDKVENCEEKIGENRTKMNEQEDKGKQMNQK